MKDKEYKMRELVNISYHDMVYPVTLIELSISWA
jgi:hypothetical protein